MTTSTTATSTSAAAAEARALAEARRRAEEARIRAEQQRIAAAERARVLERARPTADTFEAAPAVAPVRATTPPAAGPVSAPEGTPEERAQIEARLQSEFGLTRPEAVNLARNDNTRAAARKLIDPNSTPAQRFSAAIQLGQSITQAVPAERVEAVLRKLGEKIPGADLLNRGNAQAANARQAVDGYIALFSPTSSFVGQARGAVQLANAAKNFAGTEVFSSFGDQARRLEGPARLAIAGLTLADPNATTQDRAVAALTLAGEAPGAWRDARAFTRALRDAGVPNPEGVVRDAQAFANSTLGDLPADVQGRLTPAQVSELARAGANGLESADFAAVLGKLDDPAAIDEVLRQANGAASPEEARRFLSVAGSLNPAVATDALSDAGRAENLARLARELPLDGNTDHLAGVLARVGSVDDLDNLIGALDGADPADANKLAKVLKNLDVGELSDVLGRPQALADLTSTVRNLDGAALDAFVKLSKNLDGAGFERLVQLSAAQGDEFAVLMRQIAPALEHVDGRTLGTVGRALSQGLELANGLVGRFGLEITQEVAGKLLRGVLKFVPVVGALPGLYDAGRLAFEAADLAGRSPDLAYLAGLGASLNAVDAVGGVLLDLTGVGVGVDLAAGAAFGIATLAIDLGLSAEVAKLELAEANGTEYEPPEWVRATNIIGAVATFPIGTAGFVAAHGIGGTIDELKWAAEQGGELAEKAKDFLADLAGNVGELIEQGIEEAAELASEAVGALKDLGAAGVEKLEDLARAGVEVAEEAQEALEDLVRSGGEAAEAAAEAVSRAVGEGLEWAQDQAAELLRDGVEAFENVAEAWAEDVSEGARAVIDRLHGFGEDGVEALQNLSELGGALGEHAVEQLANLAETGIEGAKDALEALRDVPGRVGEIAGDVWDSIWGDGVPLVPGI
ncbi:MAG: hypothetical protein JNK82_35270 [Myxococcaceae bacterium]|nr:hypothetical protein [Myxococcaceae bacterium]